jgi:hypothetical protein
VGVAAFKLISLYPNRPDIPVSYSHTGFGHRKMSDGTSSGEYDGNLIAVIWFLATIFLVKVTLGRRTVTESGSVNFTR